MWSVESSRLSDELFSLAEQGLARSYQSTENVAGGVGTVQFWRLVDLLHHHHHHTLCN